MIGQLNIFENRPKLPRIDTVGYLKKMGVPKGTISDLSFLRSLHRAHIYTFPFENLDIHWSKKIVLDPVFFYDKIVKGQGRGGFCYELNGLFFHLLFQLNFNCKLVSAQVYNQDGNLGAPFDHMAIIVSIGKQDWLVDVGFGDSFILPKLIQSSNVQIDLNKYYRIAKVDDDWYELQESTDTINFSKKYRFSLHGVEFIQFLDMCDYHQQSTNSPFTKQKLITKPTAEGRITLTDKKMISWQLGERLESSVMNDDEFYSKLEQHFGIVRN